MFGLYTKKQVEQRLDEQFDVLVDYMDSIEASIQEDLDEISDAFNSVLARSTDLMKTLATEINKAQKPKAPEGVAKKAKK